MGIRSEIKFIINEHARCAISHYDAIHAIAAVVQRDKPPKTEKPEPLQMTDIVFVRTGTVEGIEGFRTVIDFNKDDMTPAVIEAILQAICTFAEETNMAEEAHVLTTLAH